MGSQHQIEEIMCGGYAISNKDIDVLLQTMSGFNAPNGDLTSLSAAEQQQIQTAISAAWRERDYD